MKSTIIASFKVQLRIIFSLAIFIGAVLEVSSNARAAEPIRVGYQYSIWSAAMVVALDHDLFKKHGMNVEARRLGAGKDVRDALIAKSVDIGMVGGSPFVVGASLGEIIGIGVGAYTGRTVCLEVKNGSGIKKLEQLKGKKIASRVGATSDIVFRNAVLPAYNMTPGDVEIVNIGFSDQLAAVAGGSTLAFVGVDPFCLIGEQQGLVERVMDFGKYDLMPNMYATTKEYSDRNPDVVVNFLKVMAEAADLLTNKPDQAVDSVLKMYGKSGYKMDRQMIKKMLANMDINIRYLPTLIKYFQGQETQLRKEGRLRGPAVNWQNVLRTDLLDKALK